MQRRVARTDSVSPRTWRAVLAECHDRGASPRLRVLPADPGVWDSGRGLTRSEVESSMAKGSKDATRTQEEERDFALGRVIAIVNDKGGVGKTSIAANLAGQFAGAGYRCLLVDLNRQANLAD